jgi:hypothetical protein
MRVLHGTVTAIALCLSLAGCQDDGGGKSSSKDSSSTSAPSTDEPTDAAPAGGPVVKGDVFTVNAPDGWVKDKNFSNDFVDQYVEASGGQQMYVGEIEGEVRPLDEVAADNFSGFAPTGTKRKKVTAEFAGDPSYHFTAKNGDGVFAEEFQTIHDGTLVVFGVVLSGTAAERQAVVDSVLSTWQWK